jgi:hypothetical protein
MIFKSKFVCLFPIGSNNVRNRAISQKVVLFLVQMLLQVETLIIFLSPYGLTSPSLHASVVAYGAGDSINAVPIGAFAFNTLQFAKALCCTLAPLPGLLASFCGCSNDHE